MEMDNVEKNLNITRENFEYLESGRQTIPSEEMYKIASTLEGSAEEKIFAILDVASKLTIQQKRKGDFFRRRTAHQIMSDGFVTGCTDVALVCIALSRCAGIPAKYIETIDENWLQNGGEHITGHVYVNIFDGSCWRIIDPMKKTIDVNLKQDGRVFFKEGLDSWDIGIDSFDALSQLFNDFRKQR